MGIEEVNHNLGEAKTQYSGAAAMAWGLSQGTHEKIKRHLATFLRTTEELHLVANDLTQVVEQEMSEKKASMIGMYEQGEEALQRAAGEGGEESGVGGILGKAQVLKAKTVNGFHDGEAFPARNIEALGASVRELYDLLNRLNSATETALGLNNTVRDTFLESHKAGKMTVGEIESFLGQQGGNAP